MKYEILVETGGGDKFQLNLPGDSIIMVIEQSEIEDGWKQRTPVYSNRKKQDAGHLTFDNSEESGYYHLHEAYRLSKKEKIYWFSLGISVAALIVSITVLIMRLLR